MYRSVRQNGSQPFSGPGNIIFQTLLNIQLSFLFTAVRLVSGGNVLPQGRVELFYNGTWRAVDSWNWKLRDANVVCHQLGFGEAQSAYKQSVFGRRRKTWYFSLRCTGNENSLTDCGQSVWISTSSNFHYAGVACRTGTKRYKTVNLSIKLFCQNFFYLHKVKNIYLSQVTNMQSNINKHSLVSILSISSFGGRTAILPRRNGTSLLQQHLGLGLC